MEEGQFENLPGKGKPLDLTSNPHADPADDTLYRILSKNKCLPEWVELNKDITNGISEWRVALKNAWTCKQENEPKWIERSEVLKQRLRDINNKVSVGLDWMLHSKFFCLCLIESECFHLDLIYSKS